MNFGVLIGLLASVCFALLNVLVKVAAIDLPPAEMMFARGAAGLLLLTPFVFREISSLFTRDSFLLWIRFITGSFAVLALFYNIGLSGAGVATALSNLTSVFVICLSVLFLRESITFGEWMGVGLVLLGAFILQSPFGANLSFEGGVVGLLGAFSGGIAMTSLKRVSAKYSAYLIAWGFCLFCGVVSLFIPGSKWTCGSWTSVWLLASTGCLGVLGQVLVTRSYAVLSASTASAVALSAILWSVILEAIYFGQMPNGSSIVCYIAMFIGLQMIHAANAKKTVEESANGRD